VVLVRRAVLLAFALLTVAEVAEAQSRSRRTRLRQAIAVSTDVARDSFEVTRDSLDLASAEAGRKRAHELDVRSTRTLVAANKDSGLRVVISLADRQLWALIGGDTLLGAQVAVSMDEDFAYAGRSWRFETPRGIRKVIQRKENPVWIPPDWHYAEVASKHSLELAAMKPGKTHISNGRYLEVRDSLVGLVQPGFLEFTPLPVDEEIVFDEKLFIPPMGTLNRRIEGELGFFALDLGNGILLHGTPHKTSIGQAVTHGCIRLTDEDIEWLHDMIPVGAKVYIY
jgi:predicted transcriptional regulator